MGRADLWKIQTTVQCIKTAAASSNDLHVTDSSNQATVLTHFDWAAWNGGNAWRHAELLRAPAVLHTHHLSDRTVSRISSEMQQRDRQGELGGASLHFKSSVKCAEGGDPAAADWCFTCWNQKWEQTHNTGTLSQQDKLSHAPTNTAFHSSYTRTKEKHHSRWQSCPIICLLKRNEL